MLRSCPLLLAAILAAITSVSIARAQVAEIPRAISAPTIDGLGGDAVWGATPAHGLSEFFADGAGTLPSPDDLDVSWKALWDDSNLYVLIEVADDAISTDTGAGAPWDDDSAEVYVDAQDTNATDYQPANFPGIPAYQFTAVAGIDAAAAAMPPYNMPPSTSAFVTGTNSYNVGNADINNYPQGTDTSSSAIVDGTNYTLEVAFPWSSLDETPDNILARQEDTGLGFGFSVAINDDDDGTGRDQQVIWGANLFDMWMNANSFPDVHLIGTISDPIELHVNTDTGEAFLYNPNADDVILSKEIDGYTISSESGSLNPAGWNSLDDQGRDGAPGDEFGESWDEVNATANRLTELFLGDESSLGPLESVSLGNVFGGSGESADVDGDGLVLGPDLLLIQQDSDLFHLFPAFNEQFGGPGGGGGGPGVEDLVFSYTQGGKTLDSSVVYITNGAAAAVPEPATCGLVAATLALLAAFRRRGFKAALLAIMALSLVAAPSAHAALQHLYTFGDGTANDSMGSAHGTLVDPNGNANMRFGQLDLSRNAQVGAASNDNPVVGSYLDFPNFIISSLGDQASFEAWFTVDDQQNFARIFDFGSSSDGEDISASGEFGYYFTAQASANGLVQLEIRDGLFFDPPWTVSINDGVTTTSPGVQHHLAASWDGTPGAETATLYLDGAEVASSALELGISPGAMFDDNNWLGRSQWNDSLFDGTFEEFRIYDHALSAQEVSDSLAAGPTIDDVAKPAVSLDRDTREVTLSNIGTQDLVIKGYSVTSAFGGLDPAQWSTLFDTQTSNTTGELAEELSAGTTTVGPGESLSLGPVWIPSPTEDLALSLTLGDDFVWNASISAEGNGGSPFARSDLDFDGDIAVSDYVILTDSIFSDLSGLSSAKAYGRGDLDNDGDNDLGDFNLFKKDFIAANGAAAAAALFGVPEPTSVALMAIASLAIFARIRRR